MATEIGRAMAKNKTSITIEKLKKFKTEAQNSGKERAQLGCDKISGFFYLYTSTGGAWRLRYTDLTGKRRTATIAEPEGDVDMNPAQAADKALEWKQKIKEGIDPLRFKQQKADEQRADDERRKLAKFQKVGYFFSEIYTPYKLEHSRYGKGTLAIIKANFSHLFDRDMASLLKEDVKAWQKSRRKAGIKHETLIRDYGAFKAMLNYAVKENYLLSNPWREVSLDPKTESERELDRENEDNLKRDMLSDDERQKIAGGLLLFAERVRRQRRSSIAHGKKDLPSFDDIEYPHWFIPFCHIARLTGFRPSDILSLKWSDIVIDLKTKCRVLSVTPNKTRHHANPAQIKFPIVGELSDVLAKLRGQQGNPSTGLMFKSDRTGKQLERKAYLAHWLTVKELAGVRTDIDFYTFRHHFISDLVQRGIPLMKIAYLVGHRDTSMIARNYCHHDIDDLSNIVEAFGDGWNVEAESKLGVQL